MNELAVKGYKASYNGVCRDHKYEVGHTNANNLIENYKTGSLSLSNLFLTKLPDMKHLTVNGDFSCDDNNLTSLEGCPQTVNGDFRCYNNQLISLEGCSQTVKGGFYCYNNQLTSLEGCSQTVKGGFYCFNNKLTSLEGCPQIVNGDFYCFNNKLTSLEGCPQTIVGDFKFYDNLIKFTKADADHAMEESRKRNAMNKESITIN